VDILGRISQANGRLNAAGISISIQQLGDRLYLRGTFPPKPKSNKTHPYQQRIATKLPATPAGLKEAERRAREMGLQLMTGAFRWEIAERVERVGDLIEKFGRSRLDQGLSETSWKKEYLSPLLKIADEPLDPDRLRAVLLAQTEPDTRTRRRWALAIANLLDFASVRNDLRHHTGKYSLTAVSPRDLPTDKQIWAAWQKLIDVSPLWGNVFGLMAVYGLRNHEAFFCDLDDAPLLWVSRGKTGERYVYPLYPEWGALVSGDRPNITRKDNQGYGGAVTQAFSDYGVGFTPYNLRHCWAVRAVECGLDPALAAAQMGHRLDVHNRVYQHWLKRSVHQRAFEVLRDNPNRPKPPQ
jgi:integrase